MCGRTEGHNLLAERAGVWLLGSQVRRLGAGDALVAERLKAIRVGRLEMNSKLWVSGDDVGWEVERRRPNRMMRKMRWMLGV